MRLRHIEIFHAVYTTRSITNAAKMLQVSQPSVSKVLAHAEIRLGFNLFERIKGRLIPTDEADMLFGEVDKVYQQLLSVKKTADNIKKSDCGNINLGLTPALGFNVVPNAIAKYHNKYHHVNFNVQTIHNDNVMQALKEHKCDLAILFSSSTMAGINSIELAQSELVVIYPNNIFEQAPKKLSLGELKPFEFIDIGDSGPLGKLLANRMDSEDICLHAPIKVETYFIAAKLVAKGVGVCIVDKHTALSNLSENMSMASFDPPLTFSVNALHLEERKLSKMLSTFINFLKDEI